MIYWPITSYLDINIVEGDNLDKCQEGGYIPLGLGVLHSI